MKQILLVLIASMAFGGTAWATVSADPPGGGTGNVVSGSNVPNGTYTGHVEKSSQQPNGYVFVVVGDGSPLPAGTVIDIPLTDTNSTQEDVLDKAVNQNDDNNTVALTGGNVQRVSTGDPART